MDGLQNILDKIRELKEVLQVLIEEKSDLLDPEVIAVSRMLDSILNEYERMIYENRRKKSENPGSENANI